MPLATTVCRFCCYSINLSRDHLDPQRSPVCGKCKHRLEFIPYLTCPVCSQSVDVWKRVRSECVQCDRCYFRCSGFPLAPSYSELEERGFLARLASNLFSNQIDQQSLALLENFRQKVFEQARISRVSWYREQVRAVAQRQWIDFHNRLKLRSLDRIDGKKFEKFLEALFVRMGYSVKFLSTGSDQGADLILIDKVGSHWAVQAKRWAKPVGNRAVQEVIAAMQYHGCDQGLVITNSSFTAQAVDLARKAGKVKLCDGIQLGGMIAEFANVEIPEFSWEAFDAIRPGLKEPYRSLRTEASIT
jgi:restriction system protein